MVENNITIDGAQIWARNFAGKEGQYNTAGRRNFCLSLETKLAKTLQEDGWNVRWRKPRDENDEPQAYIQVAVNFNNKPPKIIMISNRGKTSLDAETVHILDWAEIEKIDLILSPYNWEWGNKVGVKAYLKTMYVIIAQDELSKKYQDIPEDDVLSIGEPLCGNCENLEECQMKGHCRDGY